MALATLGDSDLAGTTTTLLPRQLGRALLRRPSDARRPDVLGAAEQVPRVVAVLDRLKVRVDLRPAVRRNAPVLALVADEVHVHVAGRERLQSATELARPADVPVVVGGIGPERQDVDVERRLAPAERHRALG